MPLPGDPLALAAVLPDLPRWVETRSLLRTGRALLGLGADGEGAVVVDPRFPSGSIVGRPDPAVLRQSLARVPGDFSLIVQLDALDAARAALADWTVAFAIVHSPGRRFQEGRELEPGVVLSAPPQERWLSQLPWEIRRYAADAEAVAVSLAKESVVAVCAAGDVTETLWDVGVDTLPGHRRRGHAAACFRALAAHMASLGRQPVWAAEEDNVASLRLAAKLGFQVVDRLALMSPPAPS